MTQQKTNTKTIYLALAASIGALLTHSYLTKHFFDLNLGLSAGSAICNINSTFNCDKVAASNFSSLLGIPMALWGLTTQLVVLLLTTTYAFNLSSHRAAIGRFTLYLSLFVAFTSVVMGGISLAYLGTYCLFCMVAYALSFVHLYVLWSLQEGPIRQSASQTELASLTQQLLLIGTGMAGLTILFKLRGLFFGDSIEFGHSNHILFGAIVLFAAGGITSLLLKKTLSLNYSQSRQFQWVAIAIVAIFPLTFLFNDIIIKDYGAERFQDKIESSFLHWQNSPKVDFTNEGLVKGPADATVTIVEFADFLCPHCKHAAPNLKLFVEAHPKVRLVFKAFPLDGNCNALPDMPKGDGTKCLLTKTVYCANKLSDKGWAVYEDVFEHQEELHGSGGALEILKKITDQYGIDAAAMESCRNSEDMHQFVLARSQEGITGAVEGTPAFFVNGKYLEGGQVLPILEKVYRSLE